MTARKKKQHFLLTSCRKELGSTFLFGSQCTVALGYFPLHVSQEPFDEFHHQVFWLVFLAVYTALKMPGGRKPGLPSLP